MQKLLPLPINKQFCSPVPIGAPFLSKNESLVLYYISVEVALI